MRSVLSGKTTLIVVPDGVLWDLPFQALQVSAGHYLIEDAAVSYAPSVTVLRETMRPRAAQPGLSTLLAFGNPAVDPGAAVDDQPHPTRASLAPLPETEREVNQLAQIYGASSRVYIGAEAREDRWKAEASSYRVVHLAPTACWTTRARCIPTSCLRGRSAARKRTACSRRGKS